MTNQINLEEEVICDYKVTSEIKQLWQCELQILEEVNRICKKHNIEFFLSGGTLLGAVRHKGFIPWDDDIDINMKRNEYNRFLEIASKELDDKYFIQYFKTEKHYNRAHAQIRMLGTTAIINGDIYNDFHKEIFIDIFPLDNIPDNNEEAAKFLNEVEKRKKYLDNYYNLYSKNAIKRIIKCIVFKLKYLFVNYDKKIIEFEKFVSKYKDIETKKIAPISFSAKWAKYQNEDFCDTIYMDFEYLKMPCPSGYDNILKKQYNDYMNIPENKNGSCHGKLLFDVKKDYKEYIIDKKKVKEYFKM